MLKNRLFSAFAVVALAGFAACAGEAEDDALVTEDTVGIPGTELVEVPTTDSAVVTTTVDVDTAIDVDTNVVN